MESEYTGGLMMVMTATLSAPTFSSVLPLGAIAAISPLRRFQGFLQLLLCLESGAGKPLPLASIYHPLVIHLWRVRQRHVVI
jgi:hypothetical protein